MWQPISHWKSFCKTLSEEESTIIAQFSNRWIKWAIFLASLLALYMEMVIVRWHATCFHAFAIFKNVSLLSCFLGLGIGYGLSGRRKLALGTFLPILALQVALFAVLSNTNLGGRRINPVSEQLIMGTTGADWQFVDAIEGNAFLAFVFLLNAVMFIPLGHLTGGLMRRLPKVESYSLNLLGSLSGIGLFFLMSLAWTGPAVWMGVGALLLVPFLYACRRRTGSVATASIGIIIVGLGLMGKDSERHYYSPYQTIAYRLPDETDPAAFPTVRVNHCFFQDILDCSPQAIASGKTDPKAAVYYQLPYTLRPNPGDVLVVGAGTGNDVAAALRNNATSVTAVEIDPAVLYLGRKVHPERPYQDPKTRAVVNDARSFLRQTEERFDTAIYGLLDSHTNLGAMTNVRLDSFVYTVQGFQDALKRLNADGLLIVSYLVLDPKQGLNLFAMLQEAFPDSTPRAFEAPYSGTTFIAGPGVANIPQSIPGVVEKTGKFTAHVARAALVTDDWPFFYMKERTYPVTYAVMIAILLGLSFWLVQRNLDTKRLYTAQSGAFFFLGAGFMLIETKGITELGLVFGNTWSVVAVVITGILLMVYLANQVIWKFGPLPGGICYALLGLSLLIGLGVNQWSLAGGPVPLPRLIMPLVLTMPLFFAGLIFSSALARGGRIGDILSANLFGAILGGFLEYNSMYWGFSSLYPMGLTLYGLAFFFTVVAQRRAKAIENEEFSYRSPLPNSFQSFTLERRLRSSASLREQEYKNVQD